MQKGENERLGHAPHWKNEPRFSRQKDRYHAVKQHDDHEGYWPRVVVDVAREHQRPLERETDVHRQRNARLVQRTECSGEFLVWSSLLY